MYNVPSKESLNLMPIYLYRCDTCGQNHEALQKVGAPPVESCPHCGANAMRKLIAPVGVIFKGSGFHKNDYTGSGGGKKADSSGDKADQTDKSDSKSDTPTGPSAPASDSGGGGTSEGTSGAAQSDKVA